MKITKATIEHILNSNSSIANAMMIVQLSNDGKTPKEVALAVGVTQQNVSKTLKKYAEPVKTTTHTVEG